LQLGFITNKNKLSKQITVDGWITTTGKQKQIDNNKIELQL